MLFMASGMTGWGQTGSGIAERFLTEAGLLPLSGDVCTGNLHPAGAAAIQEFSIGVQSEKFAWPDAPLHLHAAVLLPTRSGHFSLHVQYSGLGRFTALQAGLSYARSLASWWDVGVRFSYFASGIKGFGRVSSIPVDFGMVFRLNDKLRSDVACWNLFGAKQNYSEPYAIPRQVRSGLTYQLSVAAGLAFSAHLEEGSPMYGQVSLFYRFHSRLSTLIAYSTAYHGMFLFVYYKHQGMRISLGFGYMHPLGALGVPGIQYTNLHTDDL
jgi:hypothetical protein